MKKIVINSDNRRFNISSIVVGYLDENKTEKIEFIIPDKYKEFGKKACFDANGQKFAKIFDDITGDTLTFTRDITKYKELEMSIEFFKIENKDEIIARTSNLHIIIENAVICNDDISPDEPKIIILDKLIEKVTKVGLEVGEKGNYAKEQGDYAKSQAENVISANTEAIKIINDFETNVEEYTTAFNENANNKTNDFDNNVVSKTSDFNQNVDNKISEYNNNASEKLSAYNTNASAKLQEYNDNATQKIAEYDEHSQELDNKIIDTRNELERVKNDVLETGTDTDTYIHLEDSAMAEYQELEVDGVCEQETYEGKQCFTKQGWSTPETDTDFWNAFSTDDTSSYTAKATTLLDGWIKLEWDNTKQDLSTQYVNLFTNKTSLHIKPETQYTFVLESRKVSSNNLNYGFSIARTYSSDTYFLNSVRFEINTIKNNSILKALSTSNTQEIIDRSPYGLRAFLSVPVGAKGSMEVRLSIYEGNHINKDFEYEPYTGGQPSPSPSYPQPISTIENSLKITSCNKNLWNVDNIEIGSINENGVFVSSDVRARAYYQKIQNNDRITISSGISGLSVVPYFYDKNKKIISYNDGWKTMPYTFDIVKDAKYVAFLFKNSSNTINLDELTQIQLEQNSTATEYEQHLETQITANLPEGEFIGKINDTYKDTLKVEYNEEDGQYHLMLNKNIGKHIEDGTNNFATSETSTDYAYFYTTRLDFLAKYIYDTKLSDCNRFQWVKDIQANKNVDNNYYAITNARSDKLRFSIKKSLLTEVSVNGFKNWLSENPVEIYYVLETPYVVDLGVVDMPITYNEITNLFTDSDLIPNINAKYYRNFITTIQNLQVNEKALKQELVDINNRLSALESASASVVSESEVIE